MKLFFDSSAFAKRYINEPGSDKVEHLMMRATELAICMICIPEILSALIRLKHENKITLHDYRIAKRSFFTDVEDMVLCTLTPTTIEKSVDIIEQNKIRGMDSLHVASAIEWGAQCFVSADYRQIAAAKKSGLHVEAVV